MMGRLADGVQKRGGARRKGFALQADDWGGSVQTVAPWVPRFVHRCKNEEKGGANTEEKNRFNEADNTKRKATLES